MLERAWELLAWHAGIDALWGMDDSLPYKIGVGAGILIIYFVVSGSRLEISIVAYYLF